MSEKPEALRLADRMAEGTGLDTQWDAAKELRRQHAENERLREALEHMIDVYLGQVQNDGGYTVLDSVRPLIAGQAALRREET